MPGRLTTSARGGVTARYAWRYGSKLYSVDQDNNGTAEVTYKTGGDGKRRARIAGASETWYNWDSSYTVISEETGSSGTGALTRTYVGRSLAHVDGSNPATGTWRYMYHDHLGSVRQVRDANRTLVAEYAFLPYGQMDAWSGTANATTRLFTGHDRDPLTGQDYAPYRWYSSTMNRWLSRDPLGMVDGPNVYAYVRGNPVLNADTLGLFRFGIRPLNGYAGLLLFIVPLFSRYSIGNGLNYEFAHEHGFFEDEKGGNIGFAPEGTFPEDDPDAMGYIYENIHYDDDIMRAAVAQTDPGEYSLYFNNCQMYCTKLRIKYHEIKRERENFGCENSIK